MKSSVTAARVSRKRVSLFTPESVIAKKHMCHLEKRGADVKFLGKTTFLKLILTTRILFLDVC